MRFSRITFALILALSGSPATAQWVQTIGRAYATVSTLPSSEDDIFAGTDRIAINNALPTESYTEPAIDKLFVKGNQIHAAFDSRGFFAQRGPGPTGAPSIPACQPGLLCTALPRAVGTYMGG